MQKKWWSLGLSMLMFHIAQAQALVDEQVIESSASPAVASASSGQDFEEWVADNEQALGQARGMTVDGMTVFAGSAVVNVPPTDPAYGKELAIAYERAWFDLQANFILLEYGRLVTETVLNASRDASTDKDEFPQVQSQEQGKPARMAQILDKTLTLMDKKLDNELIEQGVDPSQVSVMTLSQKKKIYEDSLSKRVVRQAFGRMRGLVPYRTRIFSRSNANGTVTTVGIVAVQSQKTQQFAKDLSAQRASLVRGKAKQRQDLLPERPEAYLDQIGLRYVYDEQGRPMLLAFGRWALDENKNWSPARYERELQLAKGTAEALAQSWIVEFTGFRVNITQSDEAGSLQQEIAEQISTISGDGTSTEKIRRDIGVTIDKTFKKARGRASGKLAGMSVLKRWEQRDANGVMHVGTVVTWTQGQMDAVQSRARGPAPERSGRVQNAEREDRSSRVVNSKDDF